MGYFSRMRTVACQMRWITGMAPGIRSGFHLASECRRARKFFLDLTSFESVYSRLPPARHLEQPSIAELAERGTSRLGGLSSRPNRCRLRFCRTYPQRVEA